MERKSNKGKVLCCNISKLIETKTNSKYLIGYSDKAVRILVLIMPKMSGCVKTFKGATKL